MHFVRTAALAGMLLVGTENFLSTAVGAVASSTFDVNHENWTAGFGADRSTVATYQAAGGNPGGNLLVSDRDDSAGSIVWHFEAGTGSPFVGDKSAAIGGALEFDLNLVSSTLPDRGLGGDIYDVWIQGSFNLGTTLFLSGLTPPTPGVWTHYSVPLTAGQWRVGNPSGAVATQSQIEGVLGNVLSLRIRGNWTTLDDTTRLDNVTLTPEPSSLLAFLAAGGCLLSRRRRAQRRDVHVPVDGAPGAHTGTH